MFFSQSEGKEHKKVKDGDLAFQTWGLEFERHLVEQTIFLKDIFIWIVVKWIV